MRKVLEFFKLIGLGLFVFILLPIAFVLTFVAEVSLMLAGAIAFFNGIRVEDVSVMLWGFLAFTLGLGLLFDEANIKSNIKRRIYYWKYKFEKRFNK